jgi:uncharacterized membrane protein (DUF2068 family)
MTPDPNHQDRGVRLVVFYKVAKAILEGAAAVALGVALRAGQADRLHDLAVSLRQHVVEAWSVAAVQFLMRATSARSLGLTAAVLALDAALTLFEGWSLYRRWWWSTWFVALATATFLPIECIQIAKHVHAGRDLSS